MVMFSETSAGLPSLVEIESGGIAACLDGSEIGESVLPHARAMSRALGGPLTLLRVLEGSTGAERPDPVDWELMRRDAQGYLERIAERGQRDGAADVAVVEGTAAEEICLWVRNHGAALTVVSSHGGSGKTLWGLASTARKLVESGPGSFLLVPARTGSREGVARYRRVLVPLDGSALAESVVPFALRLAEAHGAELLLAHVVPGLELTEIGPPDAEDLELRERLMRRNERVGGQYLDRLRSQLVGSDVDVRALVLSGGDARGALTRLIGEEDVDLVVLSARGRSGRPEMPLGSVASHLVAHAEVPLLIVRRYAAASRHCTGRDLRLPNQASL
jgi:nucleotide-binding universal stress UspA family protein